MIIVKTDTLVKSHLTTASFFEGFNRDIDIINSTYDPDEPSFDDQYTKEQEDTMRHEYYLSHDLY